MASTQTLVPSDSSGGTVVFGSSVRESTLPPSSSSSSSSSSLSSFASWYTVDGRSPITHLLDMAFPRYAGMGDDQPWPLHLLHILIGYALVVIPAALFIQYVRRKVRDHPSAQDASCLARALRAFAVGRPEYQLLDGGGGGMAKKSDSGGSAGEGRSKGVVKDGIALITMFTGIQATLVMMGYLQEKVITRGFARVDDPKLFEPFGDAQFLVFCNRLVALVIGAGVLSINWARQPPHVPPYYKHAYTSFSNTMSSWCQYEALKYVSFPTQTICKASKVVATMVMGTMVRGQRYSIGEYGCGAGIAVGAALFLLAAPEGDGSESRKESATTISGMILMVGYLVFDAFTLNWQKALFDTRPRLSKYQMMMGVNLFSAILCLVSLWEQGSLTSSISFALSHSGFATDAFMLSLAGATGQLFIYATIERFGPIVFAVIMTIRQMISIIVSTISYGHAMSPTSAMGFFLVFASIFIDIYRRYQK